MNMAPGRRWGPIDEVRATRLHDSLTGHVIRVHRHAACDEEKIGSFGKKLGDPVCDELSVVRGEDSAHDIGTQASEFSPEHRFKPVFDKVGEDFVACNHNACLGFPEWFDFQEALFLSHGNGSRLFHHLCGNDQGDGAGRRHSVSCPDQ